MWNITKNASINVEKLRMVCGTSVDIAWKYVENKLKKYIQCSTQIHERE